MKGTKVGIVTLLLLFFIDAGVVLATPRTLAGVREDWVRTYQFGVSDSVVAVKTDGQGNVYTTGASDSNRHEMLTMKHDKDGNLRWTQVYNPTGIEYAKALDVDQSGNVYVCGQSYSDIVILRYDADGNLIWVQHYPQGGHLTGPDQHDIKVDPSGNVYVCFGRTTGIWDVPRGVLLKYGPDGNLSWAREMADSKVSTLALAEPLPGALLKDKEWSIYVAGRSYVVQPDGPLLVDVMLAKFTANGAFQWRKTLDGSDTRDDISERAYDVVFDRVSNAVYVCGEVRNQGQSADGFVMSCAPDGGLRWVRMYHGGNGYDSFQRLVVGPHGDIYASGVKGVVSGWDPSWDYLTVKYDPDGTPLWERTFDGSGSDGNDYVRDQQIDRLGFVYVTGDQYAGGNNRDLTTLKYSPDGHALWAVSYDSGGVEYGRAMTLGPDGSVIVVGATSGSGTSGSASLIVKYRQE